MVYQIINTIKKEAHPINGTAYVDHHKKLSEGIDRILDEIFVNGGGMAMIDSYNQRREEEQARTRLYEQNVNNSEVGIDILCFPESIVEELIEEARHQEI